MLSASEVAELRDVLDTLALAEGEGSQGPNGEQEPGTVRLDNLLDKHPLFERFVTTPRVMAAIAHVIGTSIQLSSLSSRCALPADDGRETVFRERDSLRRRQGRDDTHGRQNFHRDWQDNYRGSPDGQFAVCNTMWMIDDFDETNGST